MTDQRARHGVNMRASERALIALCASDWTHLGRAEQIITGSDFSDEVCRSVFGTMQEMRSSGEHPDLIILAERLSATGMLPKLGGPGDLEALVRDAGAAPENLIVHARSVLEASERGRLRAALSGPGNGQDLQLVLQSSLDRLNAARGQHSSPLVSEMAAQAQLLDLDGVAEIDPALLHPFWAIGDHIMLAGEKSSGKTALAAHLVLAAILPSYRGEAVGGLFRFDPTALGGRKIAILDGENTIMRWQSLFIRLLIHAGLNSTQNRALIKEQVVYFSAKDLGLRNEREWAERSNALGPALGSENIGFYVLDSAGRFWGARNLSEMGWVQEGLTPFTESCKSLDHPISGIILGHVRRKESKNISVNTPLGTSTQENYLDGLIIVARTEDGQRLTVEKNRRAWWIPPGKSIVIRWPKVGFGFTPTGSWRTTWSHEPPRSSTLDPDGSPSDADTAILEELARSSKPLTTCEIAGASPVCERQVRRRLKALNEVGRITKEHGRWSLQDSSTTPTSDSSPS